MALKATHSKHDAVAALDKRLHVVWSRLIEVCVVQQQQAEAGGGGDGGSKSTSCGAGGVDLVVVVVRWLP